MDGIPADPIGASNGASIKTPPKVRASDTWLVLRAKGGSEDALAELVSRHWDRAYRAAFLVVRDVGLAEDVAQEAMLAAARSLDQFDRRRRFDSWVHRIVVNKAIDAVRSRAARREFNVAALDRPVESDHNQGGDGELPDYLDDALRQLSPDERALVVLRYVFEYRSHEIAAMLNMNPSSARTRLSRVLTRLQTAITASKETPR